MKEKKLGLPIETLTKEEFSEFKKRYLNKKRLSEEAMREIKELFKINTYNHWETPSYSLYCDEMHAHTYRCLGYHYPAAGIVQRLINEIDRYKDLIGRINEEENEEE